MLTLSTARWKLEDIANPELRMQLARKIAEAYPGSARTVRNFRIDEQMPTQPRAKPRNKFNAIATEIDGIKFGSQHEARCYADLKIREKAGEISELRAQVKFALFDPGSNCYGEWVGTYRADFVWKSGEKVVVADAKSKATRKLRDWPRTKSLMKMCWGIEVVEL